MPAPSHPGTPLSACVAAMMLWACRQQQMSGLYTGINPVHIYPTSKMVSDYSGMIVQVRRLRAGTPSKQAWHSTQQQRRWGGRRGGAHGMRGCVAQSHVDA